MLDPRQERDARRKAWLGVVVGLGVAVGLAVLVGNLYLASQPEAVPAPVRDLRAIDAGLGEGCRLSTASRYGAVVDVLTRPEPGAMVRRTLDNGVPLEVVSIRRDYVEARLDGETVWFDRRDVRSECP